MGNTDWTDNDHELSGKYLGTITGDFIKVADYLREASYQIRKRGFSEYPIFPISKVELPFGKLLYGKEELDQEWNYYASYLDEFIQANLVDKDKVDEFKHTYKDPDEFCCLFVVDKAFTNFVFLPFPMD